MGNGVSFGGWLDELPPQKFGIGMIVKIKGSGLIGRVEDCGASVGSRGYVYSIRPKDAPLQSFIAEDQLSHANTVERLWFRATS